MPGTPGPRKKEGRHVGEKAREEDGDRGRRASCALGLLALTVAGCGSGSTQAGAQGTVVTTTPASSEDQNPLFNTITVSGTGTVNTLPDEAVIQIEVDSSAATASAALDENSKETQKVLARLKADGVPDSAIETTNVAVYPNDSYSPKTGKRRSPVTRPPTR